MRGISWMSQGCAPSAEGRRMPMARWRTRLVALCVVLLGAVSCAENPVGPEIEILAPIPPTCDRCYVVYVTVYDAVGQFPIKAKVSLDGGQERQTDHDGRVGMVVQPETVIRSVTIRAFWHVPVTIFPTLPPSNIYVELARSDSALYVRPALDARELHARPVTALDGAFRP